MAKKKKDESTNKVVKAPRGIEGRDIPSVPKGGKIRTQPTEVKKTIPSAKKGLTLEEFRQQKRAEKGLPPDAFIGGVVVISVEEGRITNRDHIESLGNMVYRSQLGFDVL